MTRTFRDAFAAFRRAPSLTLLSVAMIGLSLFAIGLFAVVAHNVRIVLDTVEARVQVVAYLRDDAPADAVELALSEIRAYPEVLEADYISREHALQIAQEELPEFRTLFAELDVNPLPASIEVRLRPGQRSPEIVGDIAARIGAYPFVEEVQYGREWVDKVYLLRRIAGAAAVVIGGAFATVAIVIIGAAIRLAIFARRDEIEIMRLVGATDGYIRRPFLVEGLVAGLLGAALALGLTFGTYRIIFNSVFQVEWVPDTWVATGLAAGGILGMIASGLAVRRHLRDL
ncbi:MAG: permease-like cell division protein FtsX [Gemmatimonadota bacterium]|jgi:cell division transport system permease protein